MEKRVISTQIQEEDLKIETSLRPQRLEEYIGQEKAKKTLKVYIEAAKQRGEALDHVLFYGPPGLGKTTLAGIIANEMAVHMKITSGPAIGTAAFAIQPYRIGKQTATTTACIKRITMPTGSISGSPSVHMT